MIWDWLKRIASNDHSARVGLAVKRNQTVLKLEVLKDRIMPIVGATQVNDAPVVAPGTAGYTGVVRFDDGGTNGGTGSLLFTGHSILTAAHVIGSKMNQVKFGLQDGGKPAIVSIPLRLGKPFQVDHPNWDGDAAHGNDVGIVLLTDPANPSPTSFLVAPFGADQYTLYNGSDELGPQIETAGYGRNGTGATGFGA